MKKKLLPILLFAVSTTAFSQIKFDLTESTAKWSGKKITNQAHSGSLKFSSASLSLDNQNEPRGIFTVDMTSLTNEDLTGEYKQKLEGHLKSEDFFAVDKHTSASLTVTKVANNIASGVLTIKDISHPISFSLIKSNEGYIADLVFDRSKYDVRYASGSFFKNLGDKLILNEIELSAKLKFN